MKSAPDNSSPAQHAESVAVTLTSLESIDVETAIEFYEAAVSKVHATLGLHGDIDDEYKGVLNRLIKARFKIRAARTDGTGAQD